MISKVTLVFFFLTMLNSRRLCGSSRILKEGESATGFQYDSGAAWAILCKGTPWGNIPGKLDGRGGAYYPWGGVERGCSSYDVVSGTLVYYTEPLPAGCQPKGYQSNDRQHYYNAIIVSNDGNVPGKADASRTNAWYPYDTHEHHVTAGFYIIC